MANTFTNKAHWALILGGSSGLGLASARKLAAEGLNICVVHRDRKSVMDRVHQAFDEIRATGVSFLHFNVDALRADKRTEVVAALREALGAAGKIKALVFSVARATSSPWSRQISRY